MSGLDKDRKKTKTPHKNTPKQKHTKIKNNISFKI